MAGIFSDLAVAGRLAARVTRRRLGSGLEAPPDSAEFVQNFDAVLQGASPDVVRAFAWIELPATTPPRIPRSE